MSIITSAKQNKFLIEKNCYFEFMENARNQSDEDEELDLEQEGSSFIGGAFSWVATPQGWEYWNKLSIEYEMGSRGE